MSAKPCKGCGKLVVFAKDPDGKWQVLDSVAPVYRQTGVKDGVAQVVRDTKALVSHFATCPNANKFSGGGVRAIPPERHFSEPQGGD